jgi:hypothetical protein
VSARHRRRVAVAVWILSGFTLLCCGLALQAKWDKDCAAAQPGTRWNADAWYCEGN